MRNRFFAFSLFLLMLCGAAFCALHWHNGNRLCKTHGWKTTETKKMDERKEVVLSNGYGIPCIGFGPGHEKFAHFPNEETDIEHLTRACAFYASLAIEYSKTPAPAK